MSNMLDRQIDDVPDSLLHKRPGRSQNPVGWNYWHLLRIWDLDLNWYINGQEPGEDAWHRGNFTEKSGYDPVGKGLRGSGLGVGYSDAEVDEVQMSKDVLQEYQRQLLDETVKYLGSASQDELHRELSSPLNPEQTSCCAERMQHIVSHSWNHIGELRYAKGMLGHVDATYPGK